MSGPQYHIREAELRLSASDYQRQQEKLEDSMACAFHEVLMAIAHALLAIATANRDSLWVDDVCSGPGPG